MQHLMPSAFDSPFVVLSFLAAPAILTNAATLLALGTSNRLARAADRARLAAASVVGSSSPDQFTEFQLKDFQVATRRAQLLITSLRRFYLAAGCFAAGTCIALLGAFADYFGVRLFDAVAQILTLTAALVGVGSLVSGTMVLVRETRLALQALDQHHAAITTWRATHQVPPVAPTM